MSDKMFLYKSPLAVDLEKNNIEFNIFSKFPCLCVDFVILGGN